jgi:hypothetical protein
MKRGTIQYLIRCSILLVLTAVFVACGIWANFRDVRVEQHTILNIDKVEKTEGNSDGFTTRIYYIVSTDKGAFHIRTEGLNAAPECAGIQVDSTYILTTRGTSIPIVGVYKCIVKVGK